MIVFNSAEEALQPLMLLYDLALLQVCDMSPTSNSKTRITEEG